MRLCFVCTEKHPVPAVKGGAIQILIDGVSPILKKKHDITIFSVSDPTLPKQEKTNGIQYFRLPRSNYIARVAKKIASKTFDVIHVFNRPKYVMKLKKAAPNSRFVLSLHNEMFHPSKISAEEGKKVITTVEKIMTISDYIGRTICSRFPKAKKKLQTVYSGCDLQAYHPIWSTAAKNTRARLRKKYGVKSRKVILFVGRLSDKKGPHLLIKAMRQVLKKHPNAVLMIVGGKSFSDNSLNSYVRYLLKLAKPLGKKVIFTKYIPAWKINKQYLVGDLFVCSSVWQEPLARVHYEAMGAGLPIITTDRGGNAEIIEHKKNGYVVKDYKNPRAFAKAIHYMLSNSSKATQFAKRGRERLDENFGFQHVAKRLEKMYEEAFLLKSS